MEFDINNMIFRVEDLTVEKVMAEYGVSESERKQFPGLHKQFIEDFIPTREDLERRIDEEGLKELCLRLPCRVLMHRWNPVQDFVDAFTRQGRLQRWTKEKRKKLLVKAVHRYKDKCLYDELEIRMQREREWCERKKENCMRLAVWEYDRKQLEENQQPQLAGGKTDEEETQHSNTSELYTATDESELNVTDDDEPMESLIVYDNDIPVVTLQEISHHESANATAAANVERIASTIINVDDMMSDLPNSGVESTPSDVEPIPPLSQNSAYVTDFNRNALNKSLPTTQNTEELANREYAEMVRPINSNSDQVLVDYVNVNTESMNLDISTLTMTQGGSSDECFPPYCDFDTHVSMTSTQSTTLK